MSSCAPLLWADLAGSMEAASGWGGATVLRGWRPGGPDLACAGRTACARPRRHCRLRPRARPGCPLPPSPLARSRRPRTRLAASSSASMHLPSPIRSHAASPLSPSATSCHPLPHLHSLVALAHRADRASCCSSLVARWLRHHGTGKLVVGRHLGAGEHSPLHPPPATGRRREQGGISGPDAAVTSRSMPQWR